MKRIEIDGVCSTLALIRELGLRPSLERRVKKDVIHNNISNARELCMKNEEELLGLPSFSTMVISSLGDALAECGLHFGMSEAELDEYADREYFKTHGMKPFIGTKSIGKVVLPNHVQPSTAKSDAPDSCDMAIPSRPSIEAKEDTFTKTAYFVTSFMGAMTGCMLIALAKLLFALISDIF